MRLLSGGGYVERPDGSFLGESGGFWYGWSYGGGWTRQASGCAIVGIWRNRLYEERALRLAEIELT